MAVGMTKADGPTRVGHVMPRKYTAPAPRLIRESLVEGLRADVQGQPEISSYL